MPGFNTFYITQTKGNLSDRFGQHRKAYSKPCIHKYATRTPNKELYDMHTNCRHSPRPSRTEIYGLSLIHI